MPDLRLVSGGPAKLFTRNLKTRQRRVLMFLEVAGKAGNLDSGNLMVSSRKCYFSPKSSYFSINYILFYQKSEAAAPPRHFSAAADGGSAVSVKVAKVAKVLKKPSGFVRSVAERVMEASFSWPITGGRLEAADYLWRPALAGRLFGGLALPARLPMEAALAADCYGGQALACPIA